MFTTTYCISGIAANDNDDNIVILGVNKGNAIDAVGVKPQLLVLETHPSDYVELSSDMLSPRGYSAYQCHDYHLGAFDDGVYFVVCPKDMIIAKPREEDDHIAWLVERQRYSQALDAIKTSRTLRKFTLIGVGREYLKYLLDQHDKIAYEEAAELCPRIFSTKQHWEEAIRLFSEHDELKTLAKYLPTGPQVRLLVETYENVLKEYIKSDTKGFLELVRKWPQEIYRNEVIIQAVMDGDQYQDVNLNRGLAELYTHEARHDKALEIYLTIGDTDQVIKPRDELTKTTPRY